MHSREIIQKVDSTFLASIELLESAIKIYIRAGRFHVVAIHEKEIAELYETAIKDLESAMIWYERASERYETENSPAIAKSLLLRVGNLAASSQQYSKAAKIFDDVAQSCVSDTLQRFATNEHLFKASLCRLAGRDESLDEIKSKISNYAVLEPNFASQREYELLIGMIEALEQEDVDAFDQAVEMFQKVASLDGWKSKAINYIKTRFEEEPDLT